MTKSIMAILKTHPIQLKENLMGITRTLGIHHPERPERPTITTLCVEIESHVKDSPDLENKVREMAEKIMLDYKHKRSDRATSLTESPTENVTIPPIPLPPGEPTADPQQLLQATTLGSGATSETVSIDTPPLLLNTLSAQYDTQPPLFETQETAHERGNESESNQELPDEELHESDDNFSDEETNDPKSVRVIDPFEATIRELVEEVKLDRIQREKENKRKEKEMATLREAWNEEKRLRQRERMELETKILNLDKTLQKLLSENGGRNNNNKNNNNYN
jgi:hypothetical protein